MVAEVVWVGVVGVVGMVQVVGMVVGWFGLWGVARPHRLPQLASRSSREC
jgi:hypothetical protein